MARLLGRLALLALAGVGLAVVAALAWLGSLYERFPGGESVPVAASGLLAGPLQAELVERLTAERAAHGIPSISVAAGARGELVFAAAIGYADLAGREPARTESLYRIGSVSKSITAVALGALAQQGRIHLDGDFHDYVPAFPKKRWPFTLRQLASHTAGVRHYRGNPLGAMREMYHSVHYERVADALVLVEDDPLRFEPGSAFGYSSYGYNMLSVAMAEAAGERFTTLLERLVFQPAGMSTARAEDVRAPHPDSVSYYLQTGRFSLRAPLADNSYKIAGGGLIASPSDLVRFGNRLLDGTLLEEDTRRTLFTPVTRSGEAGWDRDYGLGFASGSHPAQVALHFVGHSGGSVGGVTEFLMFPEYGVVVTVAVNASPLGSAFGSEDLAFWLAARIVHSSSRGFARE